MPTQQQIFDFVVRRFNVKERIKSGDLILLVGRKNTGKTVTIRDLMFHLKDIPVPLVFNPSEAVNRLYSYHVPKSCIVDDLTQIEDRLNKVFDRQTDVFNLCAEEFTAAGHDDEDPDDDFKAFVYSDYCSYDPRVLVIMDDCMFEKKKLTNSLLIRKIFFNGRHYFITFIIALQYTLGITPEMRAQIEHIFLMDEKNPQFRRKNYDAFGGSMPWIQFNDVMTDVIVEKGECLVVEGTGSGEYCDTYFHYRAPLSHGKFKIGDPALWTIDEITKRLNRHEIPKVANPKLNVHNIASSRRRNVLVNVYKRGD